MPRSPYARFGKPADAQSVARHVVVGNETIPLIAANEYPDAGYDSELWRQLAEENDIDDLEALTVGEALSVPPPAPSET